MIEYVANELADNDEDAKKIKKAEKEAQRKLADARVTKARNRAYWSRRAPWTSLRPFTTTSHYKGRFTLYNFCRMRQAHDRPTT